MTNVYDILEERGYIEQSTNAEEVRELLGSGSVSFYIGFDPTADSLHVGHFIQIMVMSHMQKAGHRPIALIGGGTGMIGDPSGRSDLRQVLTLAQVESNCNAFKKQFQRFLRFEGDNSAIMVNNADWLLELNYISFIRDYGRYFSVNRMLTAECYKSRLDKGLTFLEFNYMLLQSYDFLELYRRYGCMLQLGGSDQWSNILSGADLIRRVEATPAHALTFRLLTTSAGKKMGKTESGAVWLDPQKTSPYDFYQYWRNVEDADVKNCLCLLTFLPLTDINSLCDIDHGANINHAKEVLAFETTKLVHGQEEAQKAQGAAKSLFGAGGGNRENMPTTHIDKETLAQKLDIIALLHACGLVSSNSEARRLIADGGVYLNDERISDIGYLITEKDFPQGSGLIRKGKKVYHQAKLQ